MAAKVPKQKFVEILILHFTPVGLAYQCRPSANKGRRKGRMVCNLCLENTEPACISLVYVGRVATCVLPSWSTRLVFCQLTRMVTGSLVTLLKRSIALPTMPVR